MIAMLGPLVGCQTQTKPPRLKAFHNPEQYEGPGVYLFLVSDQHDKDSDFDAEERTFHVMLVNATGDLLFVEDLREPPSLSVTAKPVDEDYPF